MNTKWQFQRRSEDIIFIDASASGKDHYPLGSSDLHDNDR
jgi:hypothetical protein